MATYMYMYASFPTFAEPPNIKNHLQPLEDCIRHNLIPSLTGQAPPNDILVLTYVIATNVVDQLRHKLPKLLPNETLEPGFPRKISVETACKWMHEMGFEVLMAKKGSFVDGHERDDVVDYWKKFLRRLVSLRFLNVSNAPTAEARDALPDDLVCPSPTVLDKTVIFFHDESTFQANDDQPTFWETKGTHIMRPKSK